METIATGVPTTPEYYTIQCVTNDLGRISIATNKILLRALMRRVSETDFPNTELSKFAAEVAAESGFYGARKTELLLGFAYRLTTQLPMLRKHALTYGCIGPEWMCAIERGLQDIPEKIEKRILARLDTYIVELFTPRRANQQLPTPRRVQKNIELWLRRALVVMDIAASEPRQPSVETVLSPHPGMAYVIAEMDELIAAEFDEHLTAHANARNIGKVDALVELVCGNEEERRKTRKVVLFGVGSFQPNVPLKADSLHRIGALTEQQRAEIATMNPEYRNALDVAQICHADHDPTSEQRHLIKLRDGHCMFPGCDVDANDCDADHVINHEAGGWTTISNLQSLCRHHHNMKTDRRVLAVADLDGSITWTDAETQVCLGTTVPEGPLAGIYGIEKGIVTRHSGKTPADDNTDPPVQNGRGNWGYSWVQKNRRVRRRRDERRTPPPPSNEPPF
ncbi:HNH endonuclease signature motif containing protein [Corynebacterium sp.]|uniref:HNH endonuclease signature motif containing protein n=1 Tax=Corynebacterium sp. TaxID=1720 RepID=UPI0026DB9C3F|nr:HNH endonuclease signature motif containing protein [Corynebacterium sp.]MDO5077384.1 HNH endonuclease signature motif containing protein [Corynebacterium sp.]